MMKLAKSHEPSACSGSSRGSPPTMLRYGQLSHDEYFVSEAAAREGVTIVNPSATDPIVMLKHFGPGNPDLNL